MRTTTRLFGGAIFSAGLAHTANRGGERLAAVVAATTSLIFATPVLADDVCFGPPNTIEQDFDFAIAVNPADVDGDGDLDVVGAGYDGYELAWWENVAGNGSGWLKHTIDSDFVGAYSVDSADVDGDGDLDVLSSTYNNGDFGWWENATGDGTFWTRHIVAGDNDSVSAVDMDGDGDYDILGLWVFGVVRWWENTAGDGSAWTEHSVADFDYIASIHAADVDGDGDSDVLGATTNSVRWWENTAGDGTAWTEHAIDDDFEFANVVHGADIDGDGDVDALGATFNSHGVAWWENLVGDGTAWAKRTVDPDFDSCYTISDADLDDDGDQDILAGAWFSDGVRWWENTTGQGRAWIEHDMPGDLENAANVDAADIDGDGDLDVLCAAQFDNDILWWENQGCGGGDCVWDLNNNGVVNAFDLYLVLGWWGLDPGGPPDFNSDGVVNAIDLLELLGNWGPCPK